jgi:hypothetical protein
LVWPVAAGSSARWHATCKDTVRVHHTSRHAQTLSLLERPRTASFFCNQWRTTMRYFALATISSFAIMSATALCAAHAAVNTGVPSFSTVRVELAKKENQPNDRRGKANDVKSGAAPSEQLLAREKEAGDDRGKHSGKHGAISSEQLLAREKEAGDDRGKHSGKHGAASSEQIAA